MFTVHPVTRRFHAAFLSGLLFSVSVAPSIRLTAAEPEAGSNPADQLESLETYFREIRTVRDQLPHAQFDPAARVRETGTDPEDLLAWVRDRTIRVPYEGRLRSPAAVMMDGTGNGLDRAVLLAHLLSLAGHEVHLATAPTEGGDALDTDRLRDDWHPPLIEIPEGLSDRDAVAFYSRLVSGYERQLEIMAGRMAQQVPALQAFMAEGGALEGAPAVSTEEHHWWVILEREDGSEMRLDPEGRAEREPERTFALSELEAEMHQRLTVELRVERREKDAFRKEVALRHTLRPAEYTHPSFVIGLMADEVQLTFDLARDLGEDFPREVLSQMKAAHNWVPYLEIGSEQIAQKGFDAQGRLNEDHMQSAQGKAVKQAANLLGGLGGGTPGGDSLLTGVELAFRWELPGGKTREEVRSLYDLYPDDPDRAAVQEQALELTDHEKTVRGLALSHHSEVLMQTGQMPRDYATASQVQTLLRNRSAILGAFHYQTRGDLQQVQASLEKLTPFPVQLYEWATYRSELNPQQGVVYFPEAQVVAWHHRFVMGEDGVPHLQRGYDILGNRVRSIEKENDAVAVQGVADAVVESVLSEHRGLPSNSTSALMEKTGVENWVRIEKIEELSEMKLSPGLERKLEAALEKDRVLVVPESLGDLPDREAAWWELDPATGAVTARIGPGGWGGFGEYLLNLYVAKAQLGLLAFSVYQCHQNMTLSCFACNYVGATLIVLGFLTAGPGAAAALAVAGMASNLGCAVWTAAGG